MYFDAVNVGSTVLAILTVDKLGRRNLLIYFGALMVICEVITGVCIGYFFNHDNGKLPDNVSNGILAVICVYVLSFAVSWYALPPPHLVLPPFAASILCHYLVYRCPPPLPGQGRMWPDCRPSYVLNFNASAMTTICGRAVRSNKIGRP